MDTPLDGVAAGRVRPGGVVRFGRALRARPAALGLVPFAAYLTVFLVVPAGSVVVDAFLNNHGGFTLANLTASVQGVYLQSYLTSLELSSISAALGAIIGLAFALALASSPPQGVLRRVVVSGSGVLANTGGIPLAFAFVAALGNFGIVTGILAHLGLNPYRIGFSLYSLVGLVVVYIYFLVPLMVLIMLPAVDGIRQEWFDAAASLGARPRDFWRHVGLPLLGPAFVAALLVLFTDAFAAYATAAALTNGVIPLVPIQIGSLISGNVLPGEANLGSALGLGMIVVVALTASLYMAVQGRTSRWLR